MLCCLFILPGVAGALSLPLPGLSLDNPQTVTLWTYYLGEQKRALDALVAEFNATEGYKYGIVVEAQAKGGVSELADAVRASAYQEPGSEAVPDMFLAYSDTAFAWAQDGFLVPFDTYMEPEELASFVPDFLAEGNLLGDGQTYLLPVAKSTEVLVVNTTAVDAFLAGIAGRDYDPPLSYDSFATWEGIVQMSQAYYDWTKRETGTGAAFFGLDSAANFFNSAYQQLGESALTVRDGQGVVSLSGEAFDKLWDCYVPQMASGAFAAYGRFSSDDLKTGDIVAFLGSSTSACYVQGEVVGEDGLPQPVELAVFPMPVFAGGEKVAIQQGGGLALMQSTPEREYACSLFASWFTNPNRNSAFAQASSYLPVRTDALMEMVERLAAVTAPSPVEMAQRVASSQVLGRYRMYAAPPFDGAYEARTLMDGLKTEAVAMGAEVQELMMAGTPREKAVTQVVTPQRKADFLANFRQALSERGITVE